MSASHASRRSSARAASSRKGQLARSTGLFFTAALGVAFCVALFTIEPSWGIGAALLIVVVAFRLRLRTIALLLVLASLIAPGLGNALRIEALDYVDEITSLFLGIVVPLWLKLTGKRLVALPGQNFVLLAVVLGLASSVASGVSFPSTVQGAFLLVKMPLLAFGLAQLDWRPQDVRRVARAIVQFVIPAVALAVVANLVLGRTWVTLMTSGVGGYIDYRYGLLSAQGFFTHPLILGNVAGVLAMGAFATAAYYPNIRFGRAATIVASLSGFASFRRTAMIGLASGFFIAWPRKARRTLIIGLCLLAPLVGIGLASDIQGTVDATLDEYVYTAAPAPRTRLLLGAVQVAADHAPLGAGFARYGSYLAGVDYSPEYVKLGFQNVWGLSNLTGMSGAFLTDTQWPVLIGETGWIGFVAFVIFLVLVFRLFVQAGRRSEAHLQWISMFGRGAFVVAVIASFGLPVFTSTPVASLLFALVGICAATMSNSGTDLETPWLTNKKKLQKPVRSMAR